MSLRTPLEVALGQYMGRFYDQLIADTPAMQEYVLRGLDRSILWAPGRMIDSVNDMLEEYRKNDNTGQPGVSSKLPAMFVCMAKDFTPALPEFGPAVGTAVEYVSPDDPHGRMYRVRTSVNEYRAQIAIIAPEGATAHSLALQFHLYANGGPAGRRFPAFYEHAGALHEFPAVLENVDIGAVSSQSDQKNLTILVADMTVKATVPLFQAPKDGEPNDGKAAPAGYPLVQQVSADDAVSKVGSDSYVDPDGGKKVGFR